MSDIENINILIVDDLPQNLQVLANSLKNMNYHIALATSGKQALEFVQKTKFDLILLDIMMPEMSGFKVCQALKSNELTQSIPIIFLTAQSDTENIIKGFEAGAVDYITKPFNDRELIKRVETQVELKKKSEQLIDFNKRLEEKVKLRTSELNIERKKAEIANRAKTLFLANMNHELRTPLNSIMGFTSLLETTNLNEEQTGYLDIIMNSSHDLLKIITEILEYTNIDSTIKEIHKTKVKPAVMIDEAIGSLRIQAIRKGLHISTQIPDQLPDIFADELKIKQILISLISNAIKFTPSGKIEISVKLENEIDEEAQLTISVSDSGVGIDPEKIEYIFEEFYQIDETFTRQFGGLGLGLSLAKGLTTVINGTISVKSEVGKGSTFTLMVPVKKAGNIIKTPTIIKASTVINKKILVAEDNIMNQQLIRLILTQNGFEVTIAENGKKAVEFASQNHYDLIFMDIQMPVMDGIEATIKIRELSGKQDLPIIAFTAHTTPEDRQMCIDAGMNDMINKPLKKSVLFEVIEKYIK
jgi:CheY-like chemotaxis protein